MSETILIEEGDIAYLETRWSLPQVTPIPPGAYCIIGMTTWKGNGEAETRFQGLQREYITPYAEAILEPQHEVFS